MHIHQVWGRTCLIFAPLFALIVVAGCGGGGGGGEGPGARNPGISYPTSLMAATTADLGGFSAAYSLNQTTDTLTSIPPGAGGTVAINLNTPSAGAYTVNVSAIPHPSGAPEPLFSFQVRPANLGTLANVQGTGCPNCFRTGTPQASDGQTVQFIDLDLAAAQFNYSTLGLWLKPSLANPASREVGGAFSFGVLTKGVDLPTTGTANYSGFMVGRYAGAAIDPNGATLAPTVYTVGATATAAANFADRSVTFATAASHRTSGLVTTSDQRLNLSGALTYAAGTNQLTSTSFGAGYGMTGTASASFYGPPATTTPFAPPELGGTFAVVNPGGSQSMVGGFALKR